MCWERQVGGSAQWAQVTCFTPCHVPATSRLIAILRHFALGVLSEIQSLGLSNFPWCLVRWMLVAVFMLSQLILKDMVSQDSPICSVNPHLHFLKFLTWFRSIWTDLSVFWKIPFCWLWAFHPYVRDTIDIWNCSWIALKLHPLLGPILSPVGLLRSRPLSKHVLTVFLTLFLKLVRLNEIGTPWGMGTTTPISWESGLTLWD